MLYFRIVDTIVYNYIHAAAYRQLLILDEINQQAMWQIVLLYYRIHKFDQVTLQFNTQKSGYSYNNNCTQLCNQNYVCIA